jgi:uncharacterized MnhB-related membrane protein
MIIFEAILLLFMVVCAVSVSLTKKIVSAVVVFMAYSIVMSIVWLLLQSPDLALTEAAVGCGVTSILFFVALKRINTIEEARSERKGKE